MFSWLRIQPHSFQCTREAVRGPRTAPGSVWEGLPGRPCWQEGQGRTRRGDKGEQALEETGLGHLGLGTSATPGTGLGHLPLTPKALPLPSALRVGLLGCPAAEATWWDWGRPGRRMKCLVMGTRAGAWFGCRTSKHRPSSVIRSVWPWTSPAPSLASLKCFFFPIDREGCSHL